MRHPLKDFTVTSHWHSKLRPTHNGTDYVSPDQYVYAIEDGRVERRFDTISGWGVDLRAGDRKWECIHLFEAGRAPNGATVKEGQRIGRWGETKVANVTGPHLHLGLQINEGPQLDGYAYIEDHKEEMITSKGQLRRLFLQFTGKEPSKADYDGYIGKRTYSYTVAKLSAARIDLTTTLNENAKLKEELASDGTPLSPGKYTVT